MRKHLGLVLFGVAAVAAWLWSRPAAPCARPLAYRLGTVDARFGLSASAFRDAVAQAEALWETAVGRDLFAYQPAADFPIHLVFDGRQRATLARQDLERQLHRMASSHNALSESYAHWRDVYTAERQAFEDLSATFVRRLQAYNDRVARWNRQGGAPRQVVATLQRDKRELDALRDRVEAKRRYLNSVVGTLKRLERRTHQEVDAYHTRVETYQARYGQYRRFNQGEYTAEGITIYQFDSEADLVLVLAHEFGHALGLGHVAEPAAIMHALMGDQNLADLQPTQADLDAVAAVCSPR